MPVPIRVAGDLTDYEGVGSLAGGARVAAAHLTPHDERMIHRIQRVAGALLIVAGVLILIGVGISVVDPSKNDPSPTALSSTTSTSTSDTVAESSTTVAEAPSTTAATAGETTSTTAAAGSGLGTSGPGSAGETPIVNTGGPPFIGPLALAFLVAGLAFRRLRHSLA